MVNEHITKDKGIQKAKRKAMKEHYSPSNRMLLITEARKQLNQIVTDSMSIPPEHYLIFGECLATHMPMLVPDNAQVTIPHINFGHYKLKRQQAELILMDEEQLYWMTH